MYYIFIYQVTNLTIIIIIIIIGVSTSATHEPSATSSKDTLILLDDETPVMSISTNEHATPKAQSTTASNTLVASGQSKCSTV